MATLIVLRHGRSTANTEGVLAGRTPGIELDDRGREQADEAGRRLTDINLAAVVTSPILRCRQTAARALAAAGIDLEPQTDERFAECDYGQWSGRSLKELADEGMWADVQRHPTSVIFPGGESMAAMFARVSDGVRDWNERVGDGTWLLVSHGDPIKSIIASALELADDQFQRIVVNPASMSVIHYPSVEDAFPLVNGVNLTSGPVKAYIPSKPDAEAQPGGGVGTEERTHQ